jgi:uncharacterized protein (TIGR02466 family)
MNLHGIFPIPVAITEFNRAFTTSELNFLCSQPVRNNTGNRSGTDADILTRPETVDLRTFIKNSLDVYLKEVYAPSLNVRLEIIHSWINYTGQGEYHHEHFHENSFISGVFYVKANKDIDSITFTNKSYNMIRLATNNFNLFNSSSWKFNVGTGSLVLFPSSLVHLVNPVEYNDTRVSLAFNAFPVGEISDLRQLSGLSIHSIGLG